MITKEDKQEDNFLRGQIFGYIRANPGEHYSAIKQALELKNGTLAYHLSVLEKDEKIKSRHDGFYKRFYPTGMKVPEDGRAILNKIQLDILEIIKANPGISQLELSDKIGLSSATVNYHISIMVNAGYIKLNRKGRKTMCFARVDEEGSPI